MKKKIGAFQFVLSLMISPDKWKKVIQMNENHIKSHRELFQGEVVSIFSKRGAFAFTVTPQ